MTNVEQKIIKPKLGVLELAKHLGNVSAACKTMGYSHDSFTVSNGCTRMEEKKPYERSVRRNHLWRIVFLSMLSMPLFRWRLRILHWVNYVLHRHCYNEVLSYQVAECALSGFVMTLKQWRNGSKPWRRCNHRRKPTGRLKRIILAILVHRTLTLLVRWRVLAGSISRLL